MTVVTSDNRYGTAQLIVAPTLAQGANYTTIASALAAAVSGQTIFIRPGTYTENITLVAGVDLAAYGGDGLTGIVTISGNVTASYNGIVSITGIRLITNNAACLTVSGSSTSTLYLIGCTITGSNATAMSINAANFAINVNNSICNTLSNNLLFAITTIAGIAFRSSQVSAGSGANTIAAGAVNIFNCTIGTFSITTSTTGGVNCYNSFWDNSGANLICLTFAGTGTGNVFNSSLFAGSASIATIGSGCAMHFNTCALSSSNTNVLTGAGTLNYGGLTYDSSSSTINTTTRNFLIESPRVESWTPTVVGSTGAGTATYTVQVGSYTRIGPLVYLTFALTWNTGTGTGNLMIGGLPVNIVATAGLRTIGTLTLGSSLAPPAATVTVYSTAAGDANQTQLFCQVSNATGGGAAIAYAAAGGCNGTIIYIAA